MATISKRKTVVTDPEGNKITTKTRKTNILGPKGATKVITKYANPASSGKKRDVQTFAAPKKEVDTSYKKGGTTKMKKYAMGGSALRPATDKANRGMYQKGGARRNAPSYMKSQAAAEKLYDTDPSVRTYTNEYTGAKIPTGPMAYDEYQNAAERAADKRGQAMRNVPGYKTGGMVNANSKITAAKTPGSKGVKSGVNPKANAQASAKGKVGGISKAPKGALPKAQMGAIVNGPKSPGGKPKAGGAILKKTDPTLGGRIPKSFIGTGKPKAGGAILKGTSKAKMGGMKGKSC